MFYFFMNILENQKKITIKSELDFLKNISFHKTDMI